METWYVVYETESGIPVSYGSVLADPMPEHLSVYQMTEDETEGVRNGTHEWYAETLSVLPRPE